MEEQEIDLRDYLRVLKKRWGLVVGITIGCAVISAVYSLFLPDVYESSAIIEPAKINNVPVETSAIGELLFKNPLNPYLKGIAEQMGLKEEGAYILPEKFKMLDKLGYIQVVGKGKRPEEAKRLVDVIVSLILKRHEELVKNALEISNDEMSNLKEQLLTVKSEIEQLNKKIQQREKTDILAQSYIFQSLNQAKEDASKRQTAMESAIRAKEMELKYYTKTASVIAESVLPLMKSGPSKRNIVITATVISFFVSMFLAFVVEYFQKNPL
ncbi:MAG: Wzz/FepE/Etk N-terminal domain-containing protein [Elusimicrobiota bacterium]